MVCTSVQFSLSVVFDSLQPYGLQHARLPCLSPPPGACLNSCPSSRWCIQPSHLLSSPSPPAFNLSQNQGLFQWVSSLHQVAKVLEFRFSISPSSKYSGLISFRIYWLDLLAVQGTLKSLLQHHSSKASSLCFLFSKTIILISTLLKYRLNEMKYMRSTKGHEEARSLPTKVNLACSEI